MPLQIRPYVRYIDIREYEGMQSRPATGQLGQVCDQELASGFLFLAGDQEPGSLMEGMLRIE